MKEKNAQKNSFYDTNLSEEEAANLAEELKAKLNKGDIATADQSLINKIIAGLSDKRGLLRRTFSESLGIIGNKTLPALQKVLLQSQNVTARRAAAKTLKLVGNPSALPSLKKAFQKDPDPVVQGSAAAAIAIFGQKAIPYLIDILESSNSSEMQCGLASWGIAFIGSQAASSLIEAAKSPNEKVRASSIAALGEQIQSLGDNKAKNIVSDALNDSSDEVQIEAIKLIGMLSEEEWNVDVLSQKLSNSNPLIRKQVALSLMKLNATTKIPVLKQYLSFENDLEVKQIITLSINRLSKS